MRFVTVRELRSQPASRWRKMAEGKELIVTSNGKPCAVVLPTDEHSLEKMLLELRRLRGLEALDSVREHAKRRGLDKMTMKEIDAEIAAARRERDR